MLEILVGLVLVLVLIAGHYDISTGLYRLRMDTFFMSVSVFTSVVMAALILLCTIMGEVELPRSVLYRMNYVVAGTTYLPFAVGFIFEEYAHGDIRQTVAGGVLSLTNALLYVIDMCIGYRVRCVSCGGGSPPLPKHPKKKKGKKGSGGKKGGKKGSKKSGKKGKSSSKQTVVDITKSSTKSSSQKSRSSTK